ncbi:hypothetical protein CVS40_9328 [Lucilia cuprina]|nr:hypothetical protein CVS40_9328 [Lucilia cuprina]
MRLKMPLLYEDHSCYNPGTPSIPINVAEIKQQLVNRPHYLHHHLLWLRILYEKHKTTDNLTQRSESKTSLNSKISSKESTKISVNSKETAPMQ